jgi:predicted branched-subunit amino acid permease
MKRVLSTSISVGLATGLYGISFGALAAVAGLDLLSIMLLSILMFSGGSQFAFIGVIAAGGAPISAITSSWLLGVRNGFYAMRLNDVLAPRGFLKLVAAQLSIDESNGVSAAQDDLKSQRLGFWATGIAVFVFWNLATLLGALAGDFLGSAETWGLDAAAAAAFLGLVWPKLKDNKTLALAASVVAVVGSLFLPAGVPVLLTVLIALVPRRSK